MLVDHEDEKHNPSELEAVDTSPVEAPKVDEPSVVESVLPDKYKGKSIDDIIKMHQEAEKLIGKQAQEVGEVRKIADELIKHNLTSSKTAQPTQTYVEEPEVDFFEDPQKAVRKAVETHPDLLAAKQATQEFKRMTIQQKLAQTHPDYVQVVQDQGFAEWVKSSPVRMGLYAKADGEYDFDSAHELLSTYKQLRQVQANQVKAVDDTARKQSLKAAGVGDTAGTGEGSKKIYRRTDLIRLKMTDPDRYEALQPEIMAAYADGRVK